MNNINKENKEIIKNPLPILNPVESEKKSTLLSEFRKKSGIVVKRKRKKNPNGKDNHIFKSLCSKVNIAKVNSIPL